MDIVKGIKVVVSGEISKESFDGALGGVIALRCM